MMCGERGNSENNSEFQMGKKTKQNKTKNKNKKGRLRL